MAIAFDNAGNFTTSAPGGSTNYTCTGTNLVLFVVVQTISTSVATAVTYNGVNMTSLDTGTNGGNYGSFYLVGPSTGSNLLVVTISGLGNPAAIGIVSLTGVNQSNPIDTHNVATSTGATASVSLTVASSNCWIVDGIGTVTGSIAQGANGSQTERVNFTSTPLALGMSTKGPVTGSQSMSWTYTGPGAGSANPVISAAAFIPASATSTDPSYSPSVSSVAITRAYRAVAY